MPGSRSWRILFSIVLILSGAVLVLLSPPGTGTAGTLLLNLGLAMIVAGVVSTFHESIIQRNQAEETALVVANRVHRQFQEYPLGASGIRLISPVRKGCDRYYSWAIANNRQDMFFAGRAVLQRINFDFQTRGLGTAEEVIMRRLLGGANIRLMFLDPRSDLIPRLAREEGQSPTELLSDIATSIGICHRLYWLLQNPAQRRSFPGTAHLEVRLYDETPYFAYHQVDDEVIIGFYFSSALGSASAAYEVVDVQTKRFFESHFLSIFDRARNTVLLERRFDRARPDFGTPLLQELRTTFINTLGENRTDELISWETFPEKRRNFWHNII